MTCCNLLQSGLLPAHIGYDPVLEPWALADLHAPVVALDFETLCDRQCLIASVAAVQMLQTRQMQFGDKLSGECHFSGGQGSKEGSSRTGCS